MEGVRFLFVFCVCLCVYVRRFFENDLSWSATDWSDVFDCRFCSLRGKMKKNVLRVLCVYVDVNLNLWFITYLCPLISEKNSAMSVWSFPLSVRVYINIFFLIIQPPSHPSWTKSNIKPAISASYVALACAIFFFSFFLSFFPGDRDGISNLHTKSRYSSVKYYIHACWCWWLVADG